ncbi:MAG TPA: hypothetical protein DIS76_01525 [Rhodospirillaceae bacterium]|nr:hypothetical protein [Rhodospirillaceae bacterium]
MLTVLPFGAGKAGLLLKETLGAARAAKATKLIQEAQRLAQAEKTPVGKAVEKVLQRTAAGREAVSDFVTGCRNRVIKPSSGLGKILEESKALKGAQQEAKRLQNMMRQNMKDQKRLQQITDQLGKLKAKHPGIAGDIDPKLMKDLQKKGITLTNSWTAADGKVMATGNNLSNSLRNVAGNAGKALNTPLTRRTAGAAGVVGAYGLGARGSQSNVPNGSAPEDVQRTYYASLGNLGEPPALGTETPVLPPAPQVFPIAPEVETYHTEINNQLQQTGFKVATNTEAPQQTSFDAETQTVKTADLSKLNSYWQQVSLTFREQLIGKTPEAIAHMTGEGKAEIVTYIREALKSGIDKTEMSAHINGMLNGESAGARIVPKVHQPDGLSNSSASGFLGDSLQFNNPTSPTQPGVGGRVVPPQNDPNLFPPRVDGLPPVQQPQYTNTQNPNLAPV